MSADVSPDAILAAASAALGRPVTEPVQLPGSRRATVLRCRTGTRPPGGQPAGPTVVVKAYRSEPDALRAFTAEAAALTFAAAGPPLLAVDRWFPLLVMDDLGTAPSLADRLLGTDRAAADRALLAWATGLGRLAAATLGREPELAALQRRFERGGQLLDQPDWQVERQAQFPSVLAELGIVPPAGLAGDLGQVLAATAPDRYPVYSPGDVCPDNNLLTGQGLRMVDFEGAGYHSVFLDAAYARMPFATCWCVFRLPAAVAARVEAAYRVEVARGYPALVDDAVWVPGVRRAMAAWTVAISVLLLPRALAGDAPLHSSRRPVPSYRQLLRHRWRWLAAELTGAADLPALASTLRQLLAATRSWAVPPLPRYPAYQRTLAGDRNGASGRISG